MVFMENKIKWCLCGLHVLVHACTDRVQIYSCDDIFKFQNKEIVNLLT